MKTRILSIFALEALCGCSSGHKDYEKLIVDFVETRVYSGVKTDLKMKFIESEISDVKVSDSIAVLEKQYQTEHAKKIESKEKLVKRYQALSEASSLYNNAKAELKAAQAWHPDYIDRYKGRNTNDVIAKKVVCKFSYQDPKLTTRQEKDGIFVLSADGKRVIKMVRE